MRVIFFRPVPGRHEIVHTIDAKDMGVDFHLPRVNELVAFPDGKVYSVYEIMHRITQRGIDETWVYVK